MSRKSHRTSADAVELEEIDRRCAEIDKERRELTARRRLVVDRIRKRERAA
jgi:hypothetical protein